jgi:hypothetical protein
MSYGRTQELAALIGHLQEPTRPPPRIAAERGVGQLADDSKSLVAGSRAIAQLDAFVILRKAIAEQEIEEIVRHVQFSLLHLQGIL